MKPYYFEGHVVVRPPLGGDPAPTFAAAKEYQFWGSVLVADESEEEKAGDVILTSRGPTREALIKKMQTLAAALRSNGYVVTRGKVEEVTFDTKHGDVL